MFLQRTLLRLFRVTIRIVILWLLALALYIAIPSIPHSDASIAASLESGHTITRVFDMQKFFGHTSFAFRWSFIMQFKYLHDADTGLKTLMFGGGYDPLDKINAFLEGPLAKPNIPVPYYNISLEDFGHLSQPEPIELLIPTGDHDGLVPPFNIDIADATSLFWWNGHDADPLQFRMRSIPEEKLLEIWPDSSYWDQSDTGSPPSTYPLLSLKLSEDGTPHNFTFPPSPHSSSPSLTYPLRLGLLSFLVPFGVIGILLSSVFSGIFHGMLEIISLLLNIAALGVICIAVYGVYWWVRNERPRMSVSLTDVREVLDNTLDNVRMRTEARAQSEVDLEAQNTAGDASTEVREQERVEEATPKEDKAKEEK
ncbi:hypothetical protein V5O48_009739 [Marasmius crinis-equi]|uniref:Uncharacterized protein n=1 Tax=Marasmius crinis-equi TaxID=585013 RepID=A0ABR3FAD0_9AGAR